MPSRENFLIYRKVETISSSLNKKGKKTYFYNLLQREGYEAKCSVI